MTLSVIKFLFSLGEQLREGHPYRKPWPSKLGHGQSSNPLRNYLLNMETEMTVHYGLKPISTTTQQQKWALEPVTPSLVCLNHLQ